MYLNHLNTSSGFLEKKFEKFLENFGMFQKKGEWNKIYKIQYLHVRMVDIVIRIPSCIQHLVQLG